MERLAAAGARLVGIANHRHFLVSGASHADGMQRLLRILCCCTALAAVALAAPGESVMGVTPPSREGRCARASMRSKSEESC